MLSSLGFIAGLTDIFHKTRAPQLFLPKYYLDGTGREVGGGIRMGNTCKSMADSCQRMAKTTIISLQLIKRNGKKKDSPTSRNEKQEACF